MLITTTVCKATGKHIYNVYALVPATGTRKLLAVMRTLKGAQSFVTRHNPADKPVKYAL